MSTMEQQTERLAEYGAIAQEIASVAWKCVKQCASYQPGPVMCPGCQLEASEVLRVFNAQQAEEIARLKAEVQSLRAERDSLAQQVAEMVAPEELRQWKAVADALRLEMQAQEDRANTAEEEAQKAEAERDTLREAATKQLWELRELFHAQVQAFRDVATEQAGPTRWCARRRADDWQKAADMLGQRLLALVLFTRVSPQTAEETQG